MTERWLAVPGFEGIYEVSDQGRVRSLERLVPYQTGPRAGVSTKHVSGRMLVGYLDRHGYPTLDAGHPNGGRHVLRVHQLVLRAFVGEPAVGEECLHGNGNRQDNRLSNLRWGTRSENIEDAQRHGTVRRSTRVRKSRARAA